MREIIISNREPAIVDHENTVWIDLTKNPLLELIKTAVRMRPDRITVDLDGDWRL